MIRRKAVKPMELPEFSEKFSAHCRAKCSSYDARLIGLGWTDGACQKVADRTGEDVNLIKAVYRGEHDPTLPMLDDMKWIRVKGFKIVPMRVESWLYLPAEVEEEDPTIRPIFPLY